MSHTLDIPSERARVFHNGDWSGDVVVLLDVAPMGAPDTHVPGTELRLPAAVLLAVGKVAALDYLRGEVVAALERRGDDPITAADVAALVERVAWPAVRVAAEHGAEVPTRGERDAEARATDSSSRTPG